MIEKKKNVRIYSKIMKLCIFCSANSKIASEYFSATEALGRWAGEQGHTIVFGGCDLGLMACVAKAARAAGGMTIGVVPTIVEERGRTSSEMDVHIPCSDLNDRKALMMMQSDVFIALPGGIGTLDEIFTVAASATIGYHHKPVILYNVEGFWDSLIALLDDMEKKGMVRGNWHEQIRVVNTLKELEDCLTND